MLRTTRKSYQRRWILQTFAKTSNEITAVCKSDNNFTIDKSTTDSFQIGDFVWNSVIFLKNPVSPV